MTFIRGEQELEIRAENHFYWMGVGGLMVMVGAAMLAGGIMSLWLLIGGVVVFAKGLFRWRDARASHAERDDPDDS